jgi:hypothetical protein
MDTPSPPMPEASTALPEFSVLIGRVSTEDERRLFETLEMLANQEGEHSYEVLIGDRINDEVSAELAKRFPEVTLLQAPAGSSLPALRTSALDRAQGEFIIVTEDHCVPSKNWLMSIAEAFEAAPLGTVAVGGCVENGVFETSLDWATFFCEYSFFLKPVHEGISHVLPGMNVTYRKEAFDNLDRETLTSGFWETTLHHKLIEAGGHLYSTNKIELFHCKKFSLGLFTKQRFIYSRYYAGLRYDKSEFLKRFITCCATLILPPLLLYRMLKQIRAKGRLRRELLCASPYLAWFVVVWALGEMWGYAFGAQGSLEAIE